ncbi:selenide, water dikinase SelD [Alkalicoccus chagannorensis]
MIVGIDTSDDAGVYKLRDDLAIVQTVDYFTPIVDDPYQFGQIAAANALSDIYAMGAEPVTVLNIVGYPVDKLQPEVLAGIMQGGADKVKESGAVIAGGHSIDDPEPKFGLSCTGTVHPDHVWKNVGAEPGDKLVLTKPLGAGIVTTAIKYDKASRQEIYAVTETMAALNKEAADKLKPYHPHAVTDVTGFGLIGHGYEMASGSGVSIQFDFPKVPFLPGTKRHASAGTIPGGTKDNVKWLEKETTFPTSMKEHEIYAISDGITSGGLLVSMTADEADAYVKDMQDSRFGAWIVGEVKEKQDHTIIVTNDRDEA